ncbi:hypothetical protein EC036_24850 [Enterobacter cloacae]|uniref:hypothetical protein n=1 Tax=Enterobacter cloacae TaxID=550 RepID=UPI00052A91B3|nr:hypothetical protein [Enterobacter cloacae]AIV30132.1 hypothetical protein EC036_24850 [Enterobacter cloacae]MCK6880623.1 hypothetical protein [Enterobacter cloacae]
MSNIYKQAYRADGGDIGTGRLREIADNPYGDEEKCWLANRVLALAVENAGLKSAIDATIGWQQSTDPENVESVRMLVDIKTPATDAFLAEVRAQGVEMMAAEAEQLMDEFGDDSHKVMVTADLQRFANAFAAQLRQEAAQ